MSGLSRRSSQAMTSDSLAYRMRPRCSNGSSPRCMASMTVSRRHRCILWIWFRLSHRGRSAGAMVVLSDSVASVGFAAVRSVCCQLIGHRLGYGDRRRGAAPGIGGAARTPVSPACSVWLCVLLCCRPCVFLRVVVPLLLPGLGARSGFHPVQPPGAHRTGRKGRATVAQRPWSETTNKPNSCHPFRQRGNGMTMFVHRSTETAEPGLERWRASCLPGRVSSGLLCGMSDPASHRRPTGAGGNPEHAEHERPESFLEPPHGGVVVVRRARKRTKGVGLGEEHVLMLKQ